MVRMEEEQDTLTDTMGYVIQVTQIFERWNRMDYDSDQSTQFLFKNGILDLEEGIYGRAAYRFYVAILNDPRHPDSWLGLATALESMQSEDRQTVLARYALQDAPFLDDIIPLGVTAFSHNPRALSEWLQEVGRKPSIPKKDRQIIGELREDIQKPYQRMVEEEGSEALEMMGMLPLETVAEQEIVLDWLLDAPEEDIVKHVQSLLEDEDFQAEALDAAPFFTHPPMEKLLRRFCRNQNASAKLKTRALLALRWIGVEGNVKLNKFGDSFVVNLDDPLLDNQLPKRFYQVMDWASLWLASQKHMIEEDVLDRCAENLDLLEEEYEQQIEAVQLEAFDLDIAETILRCAFFHHYPQIPSIQSDVKAWAMAFLSIMQEGTEGSGDEWPYACQELHVTARMHKEWILKGTPDFYELFDEREEE
ncbi:hypothetical protein C8P63_12325 [Melghirimyces profundicolus]|uniref:Uncharacterized protein n=1 Tax=Melghirimyces profundicolus TaxID=1242148 RepID=A0A2T6BG11_9BACL|nr:hypothetical protein [Melghirimyces profundicolus]PTX55003.1 hypothetical protein C8P63_12325 [Melghirimyces profundicolus]